MFGQYPYGYYPQAMTQPMQDNLAQLRQNPPAAQQPQANAITWVTGIEGAKAYPVAPGSTLLLMDSDGATFYMKSADISGMPLPLRIFDFKERDAMPKAEAPQADWMTRLDALEKKVAAMAKEADDE